MCYIPRVKNAQELIISTDCAGGIKSPRYANELNQDAGFRNYLMEGVALPHLTLNLLIKYLFNENLDYPLGGIHARTGQLNKGVWRLNSALDILTLGLIEPIMPDLTYNSDHWMLRALDKLGASPNHKYWLIHETELDSPETIALYAELFKRPEFQNIWLHIENAPLPGSLNRTILRVNQLKDLGLAKVGAVGDTVHAWREFGYALTDINSGVKIWDTIIRYFREVGIVQLHWSDGTNPHDSHPVECGDENLFAMMVQMAAFMESCKAILTRESQTTIVGPLDRFEEIERLKRVGEIELRAGLINERHFHVAV